MAKWLVKKTLLRKLNIQKRLKFAKEHVHWTTRQWEKVLFTDETKVEIFGTHRQTFVRRALGEHYNNECLVPLVKFGGDLLCVGVPFLQRGDFRYTELMAL